MTIVPHDTSPFTSQQLFLMFRKAVMGMSDRDYTFKQRSAWCADVCQVEWHKRLTRQHTFLCYCDQVLCGFITLSSDGYIDLLYIDPSMQRRGIGSALMRHAERFAGENSISALSVNASTQSRNLCEKHGFECLDMFIRSKKNEELKGYFMKKHIV